MNDSTNTNVPVRIAVTGAAGQISYSMLFRIAAGDMLGPEQPVILQLLDVPNSMDALKGVVMELTDCAFPLLKGISAYDDPVEAFGDVKYAILVGAKPRGPGMERKDLLRENAKIFSTQGVALNASANKDVKVLVVGNPANTNALITASNAPDIPAKNFSSMTRLDHNRAISQLAHHLKIPSTSVKRMTIWGNHSATQYPDLHHCLVADEPATKLVDGSWVKNQFIPTVQIRGAEIIQARGLSSAASAASAAIDHMKTWVYGTENDDWVSMAIMHQGDYGVSSDLVFSFPVKCKAGDHSIVTNLDVNEFSEERIRVTESELIEERDGVLDLLK